MRRIWLVGILMGPLVLASMAYKGSPLSSDDPGVIPARKPEASVTFCIDAAGKATPPLWTLANGSALDERYPDTVEVDVTIKADPKWQGAEVLLQGIRSLTITKKSGKMEVTRITSLAVGGPYPLRLKRKGGQEVDTGGAITVVKAFEPGHRGPQRPLNPSDPSC